MRPAAWEEFNWQRERWSALSDWAETNEQAARVIGAQLARWDDAVSMWHIGIGLDPVDPDDLPSLHMDLQVALRNARDFGFTQFPAAEDTQQPALEDMKWFGREIEKIAELERDFERGVSSATDTTTWIIGGAVGLAALWGLATVVSRPRPIVVHLPDDSRARRRE